MAAVLRLATRDSDTVVRWGGEEFLVVARNASREDAAVLNNQALRTAAAEGDCEVLQILREDFGLTADDARGLCPKCCRRASESDEFCARQAGDRECRTDFRECGALTDSWHKYGLVGVAPSLVGDTTTKNQALRIAAIMGNSAVLEELHKFGLDGDDARSADNHALRAAAGRGHRAALEVLRDLYGLTAADARACHRWACRVGPSNPTARNALRTLAEVFGLPAQKDT